MSQFTYESEDKKEIYETIEWDYTWMDHYYEKDRHRVFYIGDSISCGTRRVATEQTDERILFDGFGTAKGIDNPFLKESISFYSKQLPKVEVIIFNNGLHGWHLNDHEEYPFYYEEMIKYLLENYKESPLFIALTTYINNEEREKRVVERNKAAVKIAEKYNLPVIDLYSITKENKNLLSGDGVHFTSAGYEIIAKTILDTVADILPDYKIE